MRLANDLCPGGSGLEFWPCYIYVNCALDAKAETVCYNKLHSSLPKSFLTTRDHLPTSLVAV
jgi:hypothetical protein